MWLEYNGFLYPNNSRIYFSPNSPLSGLRLHGLEGATGALIARTSSHVLGLGLSVRVPFVLARCPFGFFAPQAAILPKVTIEQCMYRQAANGQTHAHTLGHKERQRQRQITEREGGGERETERERETD